MVVAGRGVTVEIRRIDRSIIDTYLRQYPTPRPPTRTVEVWGGIQEEIEDWESPEFRAAMIAHWLVSGDAIINVLAEAVTIKRADADQLPDRLTGDRVKDAMIVLRNCFTEEQLQAMIDECFYLSTVTPRGLREAQLAFGLTWQDELIPVFSRSSGPSQCLPEFDARQAAQYGSCSWPEFCKLPGPEQSSMVAFRRLSLKLENLQSRRTGGA